jgi:hypothetical protein
MPTKAISVPVQLPHPALPSADWADRYEVQIPQSDLTAIEITRMAFAEFPQWGRMLLRLRNVFAGLVGLKTSGDKTPRTLEMIGMFPVLLQTERQVVLGFDDTHLDFRVVIDMAESGDGFQTIGATTLVYRKIWFGKLYITVIGPFHRLIVSSMLSGFRRKQMAISSRR